MEVKQDKISAQAENNVALRHQLAAQEKASRRQQANQAEENDAILREVNRIANDLRSMKNTIRNHRAEAAKAIANRDTYLIWARLDIVMFLLCAIAILVAFWFGVSSVSEPGHIILCQFVFAVFIFDAYLRKYYPFDQEVKMHEALLKSVEDSVENLYHPHEE